MNSTGLLGGPLSSSLLNNNQFNRPAMLSASTAFNQQPNANMQQGQGAAPNPYGNIFGSVNVNQNMQAPNPVMNPNANPFFSNYMSNIGSTNPAASMQNQSQEILRRQSLLNQFQQQYQANQKPFAVSPVVKSTFVEPPPPVQQWVKWDPRQEGQTDWANRMTSIQKGSGVYNKNYNSYKTLPSDVKDPAYKAKLAKAGVVVEKWDRNKETQGGYEKRVNDSLMKVGLNPYHVRFAV